RRDRLPDGPGLRGAVDSIERRADVERARTERAVGAAGHVGRQIGDALAHGRRRGPARPLRLAGNAVRPGPAEAVAADADAVLHRLAVFESEVESPLRRLDDDRAGLVLALIG